MISSKSPASCPNASSAFFKASHDFLFSKNVVERYMGTFSPSGSLPGCEGSYVRRGLERTGALANGRGTVSKKPPRPNSKTSWSSFCLSWSVIDGEPGSGWGSLSSPGSEAAKCENDVKTRKSEGRLESTLPGTFRCHSPFAVRKKINRDESAWRCSSTRRSSHESRHVAGIGTVPLRMNVTSKRCRRSPASPCCSWPRTPTGKGESNPASKLGA